MKQLKLLPLVVFSITLLGCGGGGSSSVPNNIVDNDSNNKANSFSELEKVLPYFLHKPKHDLSMLRVNVFALSSGAPVIGDENSSAGCASHGSRTDNTSPGTVSSTIVTNLISVEYDECISAEGIYQDGSIEIEQVLKLDGSNTTTTINVNKFINTDSPQIFGDHPLKSKLQAIRVAITGVRQDILTTSSDSEVITSISAADHILYQTDKGDRLILENFIKDDRYNEANDSREHVLKKCSYSQSWEMAGDASHNQLIRTAEFMGLGGFGLTTTLKSGSYKLSVEVLDELVFSKKHPGFPVAGSYIVRLETHGVTLLTNFDAVGATITHIENGYSTISRVDR